MPPIEVREIPEDAYEVIRRRARASGRSIESYLRDIVVDLAAHPTTDEVLATTERARADSRAPGATRESILADLETEAR